VGERGSLQKQPAPRRWLLQRVDDETNGMANPLGVLPLGKTGLFVAQGGVGKTLALIQLGISVATGRRWLDHFLVPRTGRVLLALAEEDGEELDRRIYEVASALRLTDAQRRQVDDNVVALGLSGEVTSLVTQDGRETLETDVLQFFRRRLAEGEWSLIVLDTLTRFAGGDTEKDNAQATRFIQAAESLCKAPGAPTVLIAHHTNKVSRVEGATTSAGNSRGATALTDGARWVCNLESTGDEGAKLTVTKSNYAMCGPAVMLLRDQEHGGCLRLEPADVARRRTEEAQRDQERDRWTAARLRILEALEQHTGLTSGGELAVVCGGRKKDVLAVLRDLVEGGEVSKVGGVYRVVKGAADVPKQ
jgi:RecA-family ATPase